LNGASEFPRDAERDAERDDERDGRRTDLKLLLASSLRRSWGWVGALALAGIAVGLVIGLLRPNTYTSNGKLLLRVGAREQITSESLVGLEKEPRASPPSMVDELQMLSDAAIFESVAREIGPREILQPAEPGREDGPATPAVVRWWHGLQALCIGALTPAHACASDDCELCVRLAAKSLAEHTTVANEPGSNVILLSCTSTSPEKAQALAQVLASAYIERHRKQFSLQSLVETSRLKVEQARQARDAAASAYIEHVNHNGLSDLDSEIPALQLQAHAIESEVFETRVRRQSLRRQLDLLSGKLVAAPTEIEIPGPVVLVPNEDYETQLLQKRHLLTLRQGVPLQGLPKVEAQRRAQVLDAQIADVEQILARTPKSIAQHSVTRGSFDDSVLSLRVEDLELEDQGLSVKLDLSEARSNELQTRLQDLRKQVLLTTLQRKDLDSAREAEQSRYKYLLERYSSLEALGNIDLHEDANLRLLQAPTLEHDKLGPQRLSLLLRGLLGGLAAGLVLALLRQHFDVRLRDPRVFEPALGLRVLANVPDLAALRRLSNGAVSSGAPQVERRA
jgi:uncharacterized protein involved in exopolysaccharide biosynthesis